MSSEDTDPAAGGIGGSKDDTSTTAATEQQQQQQQQQLTPQLKILVGEENDGSTAMPTITPSPPDGVSLASASDASKSRKRSSCQSSEEEDGAAAAAGGSVVLGDVDTAVERGGDIVDKVDRVAMASPEGETKEDQQDQEGTSVGVANNVAADSTAAVASTLEATHLEGGGEDGPTDPAAKRPRVGSSSDAAAVARAANGGAEDNDMKSISSTKKSDDEWTRGGLESDEGDDVMSVETFDFCSADSEYDDDDDNHEGTNNNENLSRPFDAKLVVQGIQRGEPVLEQVDGRHVVLVVGKTGTGKSTLIQAIAGRTLRETTHTCGIVRDNEITVDKIVYEAVDPLVGFEIGHGKTSKTASIGCYHAPPFVDKREDAGLLYVDSPGFEDTNGQEADISTSVMLSEVAKRCRSLRFVIMISYVSLLEDRGGAMRSVLRLIRSFAKDFYEEKQSFMFLFTHSNEIAGVPDSIEGARSCVEKEVVSLVGTDIAKQSGRHACFYYLLSAIPLTFLSFKLTRFVCSMERRTRTRRLYLKSSASVSGRHGHLPMCSCRSEQMQISLLR